MEKQQWINLLKQDVVPALGCTEPVCVALCAAYASLQISGRIQSVRVYTNAGIYKNGMSAGIPNCTHVGLPWAAAIGALLKNPEKQLQLLEDLTSAVLDQAITLVESGAVRVDMDPQAAGLYVSCTISGDNETATAIIRNSHTNLVYLEKNGEILLDHQSVTQSGGDSDLVDTLKMMTVAEIRAMVDSASEEELTFLWNGVEMNEALAAYSESNSMGVGIGDALRSKIGSEIFANDLLNRILLKAASAAESRLDGCPLPTMSSSGAGTKGLVVILPISQPMPKIRVSASRQYSTMSQRTSAMESIS